MHRLSDDELRVLMMFAIQKIPRSVLAELRGRVDRERPAQERAVQIIIDHLKLGRHEVHRPDYHGGPLFG